MFSCNIRYATFCLTAGFALSMRHMMTALMGEQIDFWKLNEITYLNKRQIMQRKLPNSSYRSDDYAHATPSHTQLQLWYVVDNLELEGVGVLGARNK